MIAVGVFLGRALPPLAALLKPLLIPAVVGPFLIALIRLDWQRLGHRLARPTAAQLAPLWLGRRPALTQGLCSGNANLGLLLAALADRATLELFVFVAVAQLRIYTLPVLQRPL